MKMKIMDVNLNYQRYGNVKGKTIVLLHGWGQNIEMMKPIGDRFTKDFDIVIFDLPGFGNSSEPKEVFSCYDYVELIHKALEELKVFIRNGEHWGISKVQFLPGQKINAISGPLVGLEGNIIAVNKKKKQITVQSTLTNDGKKFDLLYEDVEVVE